MTCGSASQCEDGFARASNVMVDKIMAVRRDRRGGPIGCVDDVTMLALGPVLTFVVGAAG